MKTIIYSIILLLLCLAPKSLISQEELQIEWYCPRENTNINDGILIGGLVKNVSDVPKQVFFSIQHGADITFFQAGNNLLSPTNTTLDQSQVMTFQPGEEIQFAVLYAANVGTYDLTMTAQILDGPFWQQACRVNVVNNTEVDLALSLTVNGVPIESARSTTSHPSLFASMQNQFKPEAFYDLMKDLFDHQPPVVTYGSGYAREGNQDFEWKIGDEIILELLIENLSDEIAFDQQLFIGLPPSVFAFVRKANSLFDLNEIEEFTTGYIVKLLAEEFGPEETIEIAFKFLAIAQGEGFARTDISTSSNDRNKVNNEKILEYRVGPSGPPIMADIAIDKRMSSPLFPSLGDTVCYIITVKNEGPGFAGNVTIEDPLPVELEYLSSEASSEGQVSLAGDAVIAQWSGIEANTKETLNIKAILTSGKTILNTAFTQPPQNYVDPNPENNQDTFSFPVFETKRISIRQYSYKEPIEVKNSSKGAIEVEYKNEDHLRYMNAAISDPRIEKGHWLLRNGLIYPFSGPGVQKKRFAVDFRDMPIGEIEIRVQVSDEPMMDFPFDEDMAVNAPIEIDLVQILEGMIIDEFVPQLLPEILLPNIVIKNEDGCLVQRPYPEINVDLDKTAHPAVQNGYAGDQNACGPAAVANSFEWMEKSGKMPGTIPLREKLEELSGMMNRAPNKGVTTEQMVQGKLAFIDKYRLPVSVEFETAVPTPIEISSPNPNTRNKAIRHNDLNSFPSWDFLIKAMKEGKGVEIGYFMEKWYVSQSVGPDGQNTFNQTLLGRGAHVATVVEASEIHNFRKLSLRDDLDQCAEGGLRPMEEFFWQDLFDGVPRLLDGSISFGFGDTIINRVVTGITIQCVNPQVTHYIDDLAFQAMNPGTFPIVNSTGRILVRAEYQPNGEVLFINARTNEVVPNNQRSDEEDWLLRNIPIIPSTEFDTINLWLNSNNTVLSTLTSKDTVQIDMLIESSLSTTETFDILYSPTSVIEEVSMEIPSGSNSPGNALSELPVSILPTFQGQDQANYHILENRPSPFDLDSTTFTAWGQDGVAAMSTALHQLRQVGDFEDIPLREKFDFIQDFTALSSGEPISREKMIRSTLALIDSLQIPASIAFQSIQFDQDSIPSPNAEYGHFAINKNSENPAVLDWGWFKEQLDAEVPVILEFGYYGSDGIRVGGHWVVAYGYAEVGLAKAFYFLDDLDQASEQGAGKFLSYWDENKGLTYVNPISGPDYAVRIESAIAAQYDLNVDFKATSVKDAYELAVGIWPNPVRNNTLFLQGEFPNQSPVDFDLINSLGQIVFSKNIHLIQESHKIELPNLPGGSYFARLTQGKYYAVKKLFIQ